MRNLISKAILACIAAALHMCIIAWADDLEVSKCGPSDLRSSISADATSERILLSQEPDGKEKPYSEKGSYIIIKLDEPIPDGTEVNISEKDRKTRISQEVTAALAAAGGPAAGANNLMALQTQPTLAKDEFHCVKYQQQYKRSNLTVDFPNKGKKTFIAGPAEYLYLSADMPVTKAKQLKFDAQTNRVVETNVPQTFYLGLNAKTGDVYTDADDANWYNNFSFKLLFQVTSPTNSYGYGIGYDFGPVNIFAAKVYTKNDSSVSSPTSSTSLSTVFGVSFNIENGIKWLSGKQ